MALLAVVFVLLVGLTARVLARRMATPDGHFEVAEV
jgi:NhaP-type Na+/H+ or K+/H+ antiporter